MNNNAPHQSDSQFRPIVIGALYPGIERGLSADVLATRALGGIAYPVCSAHVAAGHGVVTDVLDVPTDTVSAHLEHLLETTQPNGVKIGILGHPATVETVFEHAAEVDGPTLMDVTVSGPSGEDVVGQRGIKAIQDHIDKPELVSLRVRDAELIAGMEIPSLDDAQVAAQRLESLGARHVLLRCGRIATHHFDLESEPPNYAVDLLYDGDDFAVFEAPHLDTEGLHGASSAFLMPLLDGLVVDQHLPDAIQEAKAYVTEALRHAQSRDIQEAPHYFWQEEHVASEE